MGLTDTLKEQAGPLPIGAWLAVVAGGLGISFLARRKKAATATAAQPSGQTDSSQPGAIYGGSFPAMTGTSTLPAAATFGSNEEWIRAASTALVGLGYDPVAVSNALNAYMYPTSAHAPTTQETALVSIAIRAIGGPPSLPSTYLPVAPTTPIPGPSTGGNLPNTPPINPSGMGDLYLPAGSYRISNTPLADPNAPGELWRSVNGQYTPSGFTSIMGYPLVKGYRWFVEYVGSASKVIIDGIDPRTGANVHLQPTPAPAGSTVPILRAPTPDDPRSVIYP